MIRGCRLKSNHSGGTAGLGGEGKTPLWAADRPLRILTDLVALNMDMKIAIVGLGYVGLPLSLQFAKSGISVLGLDIDPAKVRFLNRGTSYIQHIQSDDIKAQLKARRFSASTDFSGVRTVEAVIICVP